MHQTLSNIAIILQSFLFIFLCQYFKDTSFIERSLISQNMSQLLYANQFASSTQVLAQLASLPGCHLIASVDHINAPLLWDQTKLSQFRWGENFLVRRLIIQLTKVLQDAFILNYLLGDRGVGCLIMQNVGKLSHTCNPIYHYLF